MVICGDAFVSCVCTCMCICVHVCGGQRSISDFISQESSTLYFWRQSLLLTWDSLFRQAWLTSKPPDSFAYTSPELGCVSTHQHTPEFWLGTAASTLPTPITPLCFCQVKCYWSNDWFCTGHLIGSPWNPFSVWWFHCLSSPNSGIGESSVCLCGGVCPRVMGHPVFQASFPL